MKKLLFVFAIVFSFGVNAQSTSESICYRVDDFSDEKSLSADTVILYKDNGDMKSEGIVLSLFLYEDKKGQIDLNRTILYASVKGLETCVDEGSPLAVILEDGNKFELRNSNDFDCDGTNYFRLNSSQIKLFGSSKIKALRYTNNRDYETMTVKDNINEDNNSLIFNVLNEILKVNNGQMTIGVCE